MSRANRSDSDGPEHGGGADGSGRPRLIVFAKYPRIGEVKTRLVPPLTYPEATDLYRAFLRDAVDAYLALSPLVEPILYLAGGDEDEARELLGRSIEVRRQIGSGLGERLERAFDDAFADGCRSACVIGTDHPTLPIGNVRSAVREIDAADLVVGPADDGGYYLLCLRGPQPALFRGMPYSTNELYSATMGAARALGLRTVELPVWYDVDDEASLRRLWRERELLEEGSRTREILAGLADRLGLRDR
jgi:rSAM/selenodomain-associated transferase 1